VKQYKKWKVEEENALMEGVHRHGRKWVTILQENKKVFVGRDPTSLKDKFKNLLKAGKARQALL